MGLLYREGARICTRKLKERSCILEADLRFQCVVRLIIHGLEPLVGAVLAREAKGQVAEPAACLGAVPVLDVRGDLHDVAGRKALGGLVLFLVPALALNADKNLAASAFSLDCRFGTGLGVELLERTGGSCVFTSDGMRLRQRAEEMLSLVKQSEMGLADRELGILGGIRIGAGKRRRCGDVVAFRHALAWADRVL